jgi:hypothetical protein
MVSPFGPGLALADMVKRHARQVQQLTGHDHVCGREELGGPGTPRVRGERVGAAVGEVGVGGPERRGAPVAGGRGGDESSGRARGYVVAKECQRRRGQVRARHGGVVRVLGVEAQQVTGLHPQLSRSIDALRRPPDTGWSLVLVLRFQVVAAARRAASGGPRVRTGVA